MSTQTPFEALYNEFKKLLAAGDEAAAQAFLKAHLTEFPEDMQQKLILATFENALENKVAANDAAVDINKAGMEKLNALKKEEAKMTNDKKLAEVRAKL